MRRCPGERRQRVPNEQVFLAELRETTLGVPPLDAIYSVATGGTLEIWTESALRRHDSRCGWGDGTARGTARNRQTTCGNRARCLCLRNRADLPSPAP